MINLPCSISVRPRADLAAVLAEVLETPELGGYEFDLTAGEVAIRGGCGECGSGGGGAMRKNNPSVPAFFSDIPNPAVLLIAIDRILCYDPSIDIAHLMDNTYSIY